MDQHAKPPPADIARTRQRHRQRKGDRDAGIDGIAALLHDVAANGGGKASCAETMPFAAQTGWMRSIGSKIAPRPRPARRDRDQGRGWMRPPSPKGQARENVLMQMP